MKKKSMMTALLAMVMVTAMSMTAFAGSWQQNATGWWWQNDDSTWPANTWQWIDGNNDGVAECYYFGADGYMLSNTITPDGYRVGGSGAWEINSVAQIKLVDVDPNKDQQTAVVSGNSNTTKSADEIVSYLNKYRAPGRFVNEDGRVKRGPSMVGSGAGWQWYGLRYYSSFNGFVCALAFDSDGYLMTNATTPDGFTSNEYGQLVINGQVILHDTRCLAANEVYGLYADGTRFTDPNTVDTSKMELIATTSYQNFCAYTIPFGGLAYNHAWSSVNGGSGWGLGHNNCVEHVKQVYPNTAGNEEYYVK